MPLAFTQEDFLVLKKKVHCDLSNQTHCKWNQCKSKCSSILEKLIDNVTDRNENVG